MSEKNELEFPLTWHHTTVQKELNRMVREGRITQEEAERKYVEWIKARKKRMSAV